MMDLTKRYPRSSYEKVGGIVFFGRMLDKICLHASGQLPEGYNLGWGFDGRCLDFLNIDYHELTKKVLEGGTDEEILSWCFATGRKPSEKEIFIWNQFMMKRGWRDDTTKELEESKAARGFSDRDGIQAWFDFHDADEGRPPRQSWV